MKKREKVNRRVVKYRKILKKQKRATLDLRSKIVPVAQREQYAFKEGEIGKSNILFG